MVQIEVKKYVNVL